MVPTRPFRSAILRTALSGLCVLVLASCSGKAGTDASSSLDEGGIRQLMPDLNGDLDASGLLDADEILATPAIDGNSNGIIDTVEIDCDADGTLDGRVMQGAVFTDPNFNGVRDAGETGIASVTVTASDRNGTLVATTTTDANGDWTLPNTATLWGLRIEFSGWAASVVPSIVGTDNGTSVQTIYGSACDVNLALHAPAECDYSDGKGRLAVPCYIGGDGSGSTDAAIVSFGVDSEDVPAQYGGTGPNPSNDASYAAVGSVWGLAYETDSQMLYAAAMLKRHTSVGPLGLGGVYTVDYSGAAPALGTSFSLQGLAPTNGGAAINVGSVTRSATGDNALVALPTLSIDLDAFAKVGKVGYGDIDLTEDGNFLWLVNLNQRALLQVDVSTAGVTPPVAAVNQYHLSGPTALPGVPACVNGVFRPWALKFHKGVGYLGGVCTAELAGGTTANLVAHVLAFDPTNVAAGFTPVLSFQLDYPREAAAEPGIPGLFPSEWQPWTDVWSGVTLNGDGGPGVTVGSWAQPILSDIEFDDNDNMILGFTDRFGHQQGDLHLEPTSGATELIGLFAAGDTIHACNAAGTYILEGTPGCGVSDPDGFGGVSGTVATSVGEFYFNDELTGAHLEVSTGGLASLPGKGEVVSTAYDPVSQVYSQGIHWYDTSSGALNQQYQITDGGDAQRVENFGKANGLGDLELLCAPPPLEIGNCVFVDVNDNGAQDPADAPLPGVTVQLWRAGNQVAATVTDANGKYVFNDTNVSEGIVHSDATYEVRIDLADGGLAGFSPGQADVGSDTIDSDGDTTINAGFVTASVAALVRSEASHTYDFGFLSDATIGDLVWQDTNNNGSQDAGEPGLNGVLLTLCAPGNDGTCETADDIEVATQTTDANGAYDFTNVLPGTYCIKLDDTTLPPGLILTTGLDPSSITIAAGDDYNAADFGYTPPASIGDTVFQDVDGNTTQEVGEPGIQGVDVVLYSLGPDGACGGGDDVELQRATTDAGGAYSFPGISPTGYCVAIDPATAPAGMVLTTSNNPSEVFLTPSETRDDIDFGYRFNGQIGDVVFEDTNGNGTQDVGELGIPGVDVQLCSPGANPACDSGDEIVLQTAQTDGNGGYLFSFLPPATYCVKVEDTTVPNNHILTTSNDPTSVPLTAGEVVTTVDFGYQPIGSIGDRVFEDTDGNGIQDPGEPGIQTVTVNLVDPGPDGVCGGGDDSVITTAVTDANGDYLFPSLSAGDYCVSIDASTLPEATMSNTTANDPTLVSLASEEDRTDVDFGFQYTASLGDFVWNDINLDGVQDPAESGIGGVDVLLCRAGTDGLCDTADDIVLDTQTTDGNGAYLFAFLPGGDYCVKVNDLTVGTGFVSTTGNDPTSVTLPANSTVDTVDFGFGQPSSVGDTVFRDTDGNGVQDAGENGIPTVTVLLSTPGPDGVCGGGDDVTVASTVTDSVGAYTFGNLDPATYCISVDITTLPAGLIVTTNNNPESVTLVPGEDRTDVDFGFTDSGSIGDFVWDDTNGDGVQDAGEPGLGGVLVRLCFAGPDTICGTGDDVVLEDQSTDGTGAYLFEGLAAGTYCVKVIDTSLPSGYAPTTTPSNIQTPTITAGQALDTVDFGYAQISSIGNFVWEDRNDDTVQDGTEAGIPSVDVELYTAGPNGTFGDVDDVLVDTQTTDANGGYLFLNLLPSLYRVNVVETTLPAGMVLTTANEPLDYTLGANEAYVEADFGYRFTGSIGDFVWNDVNGDQVQDVGEPALNAVTVTLTEAGVDGVLGTGDDVSFGTQSTDANGAYDFVNLPAGSYSVAVDTGTVPAGFTLTTPPNPALVTLTDGEDYNDADFGFLEAASIGDLIFEDTNANGVADPGEPGISGVDVTLCTPGPDVMCDTADDVVVTTVTTDANGAYAFIGLAANTYCVKVDDTTLPPGVELTTGNDPESVTLTTGEARDDVDIGYRNTGRISDKVWNDRNQNGIVEVGEPGWPGVTVTLASAGLDGICGNADDVALTTAMTDAQGCYEFPNLPADTYCVMVDETTLPPGLELTTPIGPRTVPLLPGQDNPDVDFGYRNPGSIGDFVYEDANRNGMFDAGDTPLPNVTLRLIEAGPDGILGNVDDDNTFPPTATDAMGIYTFNGLDAGIYRVTVDETTVPTDYSVTTANNPMDVTLMDGDMFVDADFGYALQLYSVGDTVFVDSDRDGVYEPDVGEAPIAGVLVRLLDENGLEVGTQTTDANGIYVFQVPAGEYTVEIADSNYLAGGPLEPYTFTGPFPDDQNTTDVNSDVRGVNFGYALSSPPGTIQFCGWWLTNLSRWPLSQIPVGDQVLTQDEAIQILDHGNRLIEAQHSIARSRLAATLDISYFVGWALIGAKLNVAAGNGSASVEDAIRAGDAWLTSVGGIGQGIVRTDSRYDAGYDIFIQLNDYNNGVTEGN